MKQVLHRLGDKDIQRNIVFWFGVIVFMFLSPQLHADSNEITISLTDLGEKWPFTVEQGSLSCRNGNSIVFSANGNTYAVNGAASQSGFKDIGPIWRQNPSDIEFRKEIAKSEGKTLKEINEIMGPMSKVDIAEIISMGLKLCKK